MSEDDTTDILDALGAIDPVRAGDGEGPPPPGSARYDSILERAMDTTDNLDTTPTAAPAPPTAAGPSRADSGGRAPRPLHRPHRRRRFAALLLAAASAAAVAGAVTVLRPNGGASPAAALSRAAEATGDITSLRATLTGVGPAGDLTSTIEVVGDDSRVEVLGTYADGHVEGSTTVMIDDLITQVALDGSVEYSTADDLEERLRPFAASSAAVVTAAVDHGEATGLGTEAVRGTEATHYRIEPDDATRRALGDLGPGVLAWFQLDDVEHVTSIEVWVADEIIRRIEVVEDVPAEVTNVPGEHTTTIEFYDFDADIEIEPLAVDPSARVVGEG